VSYTRRSYVLTGLVFGGQVILASDKVRDVAIIKAHGANFRTLTLGNSDNIEVGEEVVAIGNPLSLESTVSNGIVSAIRIAKTQGGNFLQITAPISHGSSGGPLFNKVGEVVGITAMGIEGGENLNFAIPINDAKRLLLAKSSKIQPLPNEPEPVQTPDRDAPSAAARTNPTDRDYYQQLYDAGAFSRGLPNRVCFSDDANSGTFFTFNATAYDERYYNAQARLRFPTFSQARAAGFPSTTPEEKIQDEIQFKIMREVTRTMPYATFLMKGLFESYSPEAQQFFRDGGRILEETVYENGVNVNTLHYRWDGSSWFISIPPADPNAYTRTSKILRLSIEPTTMRYADSTTVTIIVGNGATAATNTTRYGPWTGVCETPKVK